MSSFGASLDIGQLLILIVALAIGWFLGYRSAASQKLNTVQKFLQNWGLTDKSQANIDHIQTVMPLEEDSFDTYLGLGNTYRKRGDTQKAVELHQWLQQADSLSLEQRSQARYEEALDYQAAGFLDKAEDVLRFCITETTAFPRVQTKALRSLVTVLCRHRDWPEAYAQAQHLAKLDSRFESLADFVLAEGLSAQLTKNQTLEKAQQKELQQRVEARQNPHLILLQLQMASSLDFQKTLVQRLLTRHPENAPQLAAFLQQPEQAELLEAMITLGQKDAEQQAALSVLQVYLPQQTGGEEKRAHYQCRRCGFDTKVFDWQCPKCRDWGQLNPR